MKTKVVIENQKYAIIRIVNIIAELKDDNAQITEPCYIVVEKNIETLEIATKIRNNYRYSENYIIINYW